MFTLRPGIDEERREGGGEIKQVFCAGFEVGLGAQLRVPRKQRLGGGEGRTLQVPRPTVLGPVGSLYFRRGAGQVCL